VHPHKIVIREVERNRSAEILKLLAESVREAGQPAHVHSHRQILALHVGSGNQIFGGIAAHDEPINLYQLGGAVAAGSVHIGLAVNFKNLAERKGSDPENRISLGILRTAKSRVREILRLVFLISKF
jgi:hypothetical protein